MRRVCRKRGGSSCGAVCTTGAACQVANPQPTLRAAAAARRMVRVTSPSSRCAPSSIVLAKWRGCCCDMVVVVCVWKGAEGSSQAVCGVGPCAKLVRSRPVAVCRRGVAWRVLAWGDRCRAVQREMNG